MRSRQVRLASRPRGPVRRSDFELVEVHLPEPGEGEVLVANVALSLDPYMRPKMDDAGFYTSPYELHAPMEGGAVGLVLESADSRVPVGTAVQHRSGWREHAVLPGDSVQVLDAAGVPLSTYLGALGTAGFTAWVGLHTIARQGAGDRVFVSAAAGSVGSLAGQIARLRDSERVVGSAGSPAKVGHLRDDLGFDGGIDYRHEDLLTGLRRELPEGCDVYFDNVGGDHLAAALEVMNDFGRIVLCGAISGYQTGDRVVPGNMFHAVRKRLRLEGFILSDHGALRQEFQADMRGWLDAGEIVHLEWVLDGLEQAPDAFLGLLAGRNTGKTIVRLIHDDGRPL